MGPNFSPPAARYNELRLWDRAKRPEAATLTVTIIPVSLAVVVGTPGAAASGGSGVRGRCGGARVAAGVVAGWTVVAAAEGTGVSVGVGCVSVVLWGPGI